MIYLKTENIYNYLITTPLNWVCECFSSKPHEKATPKTEYLYQSIVSQNDDEIFMDRLYSKVARVQFTIFSKIKLWDNETSEGNLMSMVSILEDELYKFCDDSITDIDWIKIIEIVGDTLSPIFTDEKDRPYIVKDFLITYKV
jgi:hypothetical protein